MYTRGRKLRFTAMSALVVLALTGFSSGHGHGSGHSSRTRHSGGTGGGGCSNSAQDHDSSTSSGNSRSSDFDGYGSNTPSDSATSTSTAGHGSTYRTQPTRHTTTPTATSSPTAASPPMKDGTAVLVHCASVDDPYATVEVRNPNGREGIFTMKMTFRDERGSTMIQTSKQVSLPAHGKETVRVPVAGSTHVEDIAHCVVDSRAGFDY